MAMQTMHSHANIYSSWCWYNGAFKLATNICGIWNFPMCITWMNREQAACFLFVTSGTWILFKFGILYQPTSLLGWSSTNIPEKKFINSRVSPIPPTSTTVAIVVIIAPYWLEKAVIFHFNCQRNSLVVLTVWKVAFHQVPPTPDHFIYACISTFFLSDGKMIPI